MPPAPRRILQHHDHLLRPEPARAAAQEGPARREQGGPEVREQRREFCEELAGIDPRRLVFVDECGVNTAMTRTHGRAPVGQRVYADTPDHCGSITLTYGVRRSKIPDRSW